jgi:ATPase subunit of ABC transporter with duplicated ATPase domains
VIVATGVELRVGARLLLEPVSFRISPGDRIGLVGRNGAGKTTLTKVLAGDGLPTAGTVTRTGAVGYLPQDPRTGDLQVLARDRILSARGLDQMVRATCALPRRGWARPTSGSASVLCAPTLGWTPSSPPWVGMPPSPRPRPSPPRSACQSGCSDQPLETLSGGQRRRVELSRILFSGADTLLLDEPTNHLDADSIVWLRDYLKAYKGGLVVISHDGALLDAVVNRVFHLDANRSALDVYNVGWKPYLLQRETDERRRKRERLNAEKKASALMAQADKMRAKATKATAAQNMARRAERLLAGVEGERAHDRVAKLRFPDPAPCGKTPLMASGLSRSYGSLEIFTDVDLAIDRGSRVVVLGLNGAGKTTLLRILAGVDAPDTGQVEPGHGLKLGYYAQEHENLDIERTVLANMKSAAPDLGETEVRKTLGSFLFTGDDVDKPAGVLSGGEKTRLSLAMLVVSAANVLLLDEPTNNLDPASRAEILGALRTYRGAVVLVTHDEGAVDALEPERVLLLPDGVEDLWGPDYKDLVALA